MRTGVVLLGKFADIITQSFLRIHNKGKNQWITYKKKCIKLIAISNEYIPLQISCHEIRCF